MVEVESELWRSPPAQAVPPTASCPGPYPDVFLTYPRWEITTSLGSLCLCSVILTVWKALLTEVPVFKFVFFWFFFPCPVTEHCWKEPGWVLLHSPFRCLITFIMSLPFRTNSPSSLSCSSYVSCSRLP